MTDTRDKVPGALPGGAKESTVMSMSAVVDVKPQKLRAIRPYFEAAKDIPGSLPAEAQITLHNFICCFERQRSVKEGAVADVVWGFEQAQVPKNLTVVGLLHLERLGYISFRAPDGEKLDRAADGIDGAWIKYEPKMLELVHGA